MSFGSDALFTAFEASDWSANASTAPTVEDAYKELPGQSLAPDARLSQLEIENYQLRRLLNVVKPPKNMDSEKGPICQINFYHNDLSRSHKDRIIRMVSDYMVEVKNEKLTFNMPQLPYQKSAIPISIDDNEDADDHTIIQSVQVYPDEFIVDKIGEPIGNHHDPRGARWEVPDYDTLYKDTLALDPEEDLKKLEERKSKLSKCCFNCGDLNCSIAKCPKPKDPAAISKRKEEFMAAIGQRSGPKRSGPSVRLFEASDYSTNKNYKDFKPGAISESLRLALGMDKTELPSWIYRMRNAGYPPGWLKEAESFESVVSGVNVKEEGECNELTHLDLTGGPERKLIGIDMGQIINYPGFNAPLPDNCDDKPPKACPKWSQQDNYRTYVESYCRRQNVKIIQKRRASGDGDAGGNDESAAKKAKLDDTENELEIVDELEEPVPEFKPGWVAHENAEGEGEAETSNKGLPNRSKWARNVNAFEVAAYQPAPTKTGAYLKLQKTLRQKNEE